MDDRHAVA